MGKSKQKKEEVKEKEEQPQEDVIMIPEGPDMTEYQVRLQLLGLSKEILEHQSHLGWETHKKAIDVTIDDVIDGAKLLFKFVSGEDT